MLFRCVVGHATIFHYVLGFFVNVLELLKEREERGLRNLGIGEGERAWKKREEKLRSRHLVIEES